MTRPQTRSAAVQDTAALRLRLDADQSDAGASAVEFALVVPLLLLLVFGIIDFGVAFGQNLALNNGSRDAARFAVVRQIDGSPARSCFEVLRRARQAATTIAMPSNNVAVNVTVNGTTVCSVAAGTALPNTANTPALAKAPCVGTVSGVSDQLRVSSTYTAALIIPILGPNTITLVGNGYFRCEYN